jgi:glutamate N-acetyltransferase / amino-acid N-acetyltransferase
MTTAWPRGFHSYVANIGVKNSDDDFVVITADEAGPASAVFTLSRFAGCSVTLSRRHAADHSLKAFVVLSKNANVATGAEGMANAEEIVAAVAARLGCAPSDILIASTGVIGRQYPMERLRPHLAAIPLPTSTSADGAARGIMTTDTFAKLASASVGAARIVGIAKGVGMIEPDMATLITLFTTDAAIGAGDLDAIFRRVIERTFNAVSIDTDTSTSDTAAIITSSAAGVVDLREFEQALFDVALELTRMVARDGEGAEKLIVVNVTGACDDAQAKRVGKAIVNSPLVKTAVHGADPNWGRVAMAIGKCSDETDIDQDLVVIRFGTQEVYPAQVGDDGLQLLTDYMRGDEVAINVDLAIASGAFTVYGCDLTDGYIRINADYTT